MYIDLTQTIKHATGGYPGDTPYQINIVATLENDGYHVTVHQHSMHIGTHLDVPKHMIKDKRSVAEFDVSNFTGKTILLDGRHQRIINHLEGINFLNPGDIALIRTDHSTLFGTQAYYESYPILSETIVNQLISKKINMLGLDTPSPDVHPFKAHKALFKAGVFIIENLTNLHQLPFNQHFTLFAFPLKIEAEASLLRVVAKFNKPVKNG